MMTTEQEILQFAESQWGARTWERTAAKLAEECGEVCGAIVKIEEKRATNEQLDQEIGDALIVLSQMAAKRGTTLETLRVARFEQIRKRAWATNVARGKVVHVPVEYRPTDGPLTGKEEPF